MPRGKNKAGKPQSKPKARSLAKSRKGSIGKRITSYCENLVISQGGLRGQTFSVLPWEKEIIEKMVGHTETAFSMGRSNGKTSFMAALACCAIDPDGPLFQPRGFVQVNASSLKQGGILFEHVMSFLEPILTDDEGRRLPTKGVNAVWKSAENHHNYSLEHIPSRTRLEVLGSDKARAHGRAPHLTICDEPAQWQGGGDALIAAIRTARGKQENERLVCIGTRPEDPTHWFSRMLDAPDDEVTWSKSYHADKGDDDFAVKTLRKANPSYNHIPTLREALRQKILKAKSNPSELAEYRALNLNMGTPETDAQEFIVDLDIWRGLVLTSDPAPREGPLAIGIDLGGGTSMSAVAFYWAKTGRLETYGAFPAKPTLIERGKRDGVGDLYDNMLSRGECAIYGGYETDNVKFLKERLSEVRKYEWLGIEADNYAKTKVGQAMLLLSLPQDMVDHRRVGRGPSGKEDVEAFQSEANCGHMSVEHNLILDHAISQSKLVRDTNGNPALNKARKKGRIDVLQAAILAVGMGYRWRVPPEGGGDDDFYKSLPSPEDKAEWNSAMAGLV